MSNVRTIAAALAGCCTLLAAGAAQAQAQEKLKIGIILTLSGPSAVIGQQARDSFNLAIKTLGGKLGGLDTEVIVVDDELKPDLAVTKVKGLIDRDKVNFVVGFGVSRPSHVQAIARAGADGVAVGAALVDSLGRDGRDVAAFGRLMGELRAATVRR